MNKSQLFDKISPNGNIPLSRFGHTMTLYTKNDVCMFGGAIIMPQNKQNLYSISDHLYTLNMLTFTWEKIQPTGCCPSQRAAHGTVLTQPHIMLLFGGATRNGGLSSNQLYHLTLKKNIGIWNMISVVGKIPEKKYGHYLKPYIVVFGGTAGDKVPLNDLWVLNISKSPLKWTEIIYEGENPQPRMYHSAALCSSGCAKSLIVVFGGRSSENKILDDSWGISKHRDDT